MIALGREYVELEAVNYSDYTGICGVKACHRSFSCKMV